jgi:uncharacterized membrane protein YeaQ/YmgE (transglycosylase-associated protein family)
MELLISLISGAAGGNAAGNLIKGANLGVLGNSLAGIVGGGIGGQVLSMLGMGGVADAAGAVEGLDIGAIIGQVAAGGAGGGILLAVIGAVKNAMGK